MGSWKQFHLDVNDLTREHSRRCEGRKVIRRLGPGQDIHQLSSCRSFTARFFFSEIRDFCDFEDIIHLVGMPVRDSKNVR